MAARAETSAAKRRRERRLRSWWRHEQQSVAMALSAAAHHSFDKVAAGEKNVGLRAQKTDRAGEAANRALRRQSSSAAGDAVFSSSLVHAVQPADVEQVLDVPVLHMFENDNNLYEFLDLASFQEIPEVQVVDVHVPPGPVPANCVEQVVDVPVRGQVPQDTLSKKIVEQVVDVPGRVPLGLVSERIVEQVVDAPVRGQVPQDTFSERIVEQVVDVPVARDSLPGHAQQLDTRTPAACWALRRSYLLGFFALFPLEEQVRRSPRSRVRACTRTRAHPRRLLITTLLWFVMNPGYRSCPMSVRTSGTDMSDRPIERCHLAFVRAG